MANLLLVEKSGNQDKSFLTTPVRRYSDHCEPSQFLEYFYPTEQLILRSNDFESYDHRTKRTDEFFGDATELRAYVDILSESSNNEDQPPASEELFFETQDENLYTDITKATQYAPPFTRLQRELLLNIARHVFDSGDNVGTIERKRDRRLDLIRGYCKELKRKRYARCYRRFTKVRSKRLDLGLEALDLLELEIEDKNLNRRRYYEAEEPSEYTSLLLPARRKAIKAKFLQYVTDPKYRRTYRDRVYFNCNLDIPGDDEGLHMHGQKLLLADADQTIVDSSSVLLDALAQDDLLHQSRSSHLNDTSRSSVQFMDAQNRSLRTGEFFADMSGANTVQSQSPRHSKEQNVTGDSNILRFSTPRDSIVVVNVEKFSTPRNSIADVDINGFSTPRTSIAELPELNMTAVADKAGADQSVKPDHPELEIGSSRLPIPLVRPGLFEWFVRNILPTFKKAEDEKDDNKSGVS